MGEEKMWVSPLYQKGDKIWWFVFRNGFKYKSEVHFIGEGERYHDNYPLATKKMMETWEERDPVVLPKTAKLAKKWGVKMKGKK